MVDKGGAGRDSLQDAGQIMASLAIVASFVVYYGMQHGAPEQLLRIWTMFEKNEILQALLLPTVLGTAAYSLKLVYSAVHSKIFSRFYCSITMTNKDPNFEAVINFIGKKGIVHTGSLLAETYQKKNQTWKEWRSEFSLGSRVPPRLEYRPANNNDIHVMQYKGKQIILQRQKGETVVTGWERTPTQMETLTLSAWGRDNKNIKEFLADALMASFEDETDQLNVFVMVDDWCGCWEKALSKKPRALESVILDEDLATDLVEDAKTFLSAAEWYQGAGIPYRRGYLLHGPPGCGKTSFCQALAGALKLDVCMLTLANKGLNDNKLAECLRDAPSNSIVLLEDVDAVFVDRSVASESKASGVTFSGLLNALDGVASQEGRLFFMTTNHLEKLDPALVRPGRCDVKVEIKRASRKQMRLMFTRFFPGEEHLAECFAARLPEEEISMAQLQGHLLECKRSAQEAIDQIPKLLQNAKPVRLDRMTVFEHLRRVGLEQFAHLFEYYGYGYKQQLKGLTIDTVLKWSITLALDKVCLQRLTLLLSGEDDTLLSEYQLADVSTMKEMFLMAYSTGDDELGGTALVRAPSDDVQLKRATSFGMQRAQPVVKNEEVLARQLCEKLSINGKGAVSVWQLAWHFDLFPGDPQGAVDECNYMMEPHVPGSGPGPSISTFDFLRRCNLEEHADAFEEEGHLEAKDLQNLSEDDLKKLGVKGKGLARMQAVLSASDTLPAECFGFLCPSRPRLVREFRLRYPDALPWEATRFAKLLSDTTGCGLVSLHQVHAHFERHADAAAAVNSAVKEMIEVVRVKPEVPPPPPEPTEWIYTWLKAEGLEEYAEKFIEQHMLDKAEFVAMPRLTMEQLETVIGIDTLGHRRKIHRMIEGLTA